MKLTNQQARRAMTALHFDRRDLAGLSKLDQVAAHVRLRGSIQFDPLNVVGRNPDLALQSRVDGYSAALLNEALYGRRALIDGYDKNLCVYPIEDYPILRRMNGGDWLNHFRSPEIDAALDKALAEIRERGALCSDDIDMPGKVRWPWGMATLARAAIETLWMDGKLVIHHRKGTRRYFDLTERHVPGDLLSDDRYKLNETEFIKWQVRRRIKSAGLLWNRASDAFLGLNIKKPAREAAFAALIGSGEIVPISIEGFTEPLYAVSESIDFIERAVKEPAPFIARALAPLDNFLWDRKLIEALFGFTYRWEVYTPAAKREYGYYVLPVLCGDSLVARFEPDHYRGGPLSIKSWWWERGAKPDARTRAAADECMGKFEAYLKNSTAEI